LCAVQQASSGGGIIGYFYSPDGTRLAKGTLTSFSCDLTQNGAALTNLYTVGPSGEQIQEIDGNSNLLHTNALSTGRWMSPDPTGGRLANPQTFNKYSYVVNNPLSFTDPLGLWHCVWSESSSGFDEDDTPENGGATQQQCTDQGGEAWAADPGDQQAPSNTSNYQIGVGNSGQQSGNNNGGDAPIDNPIGAGLFGAQGLPYWTAANAAVNFATIGTAAAYGGAFFAPEIAAGTSAAATWGANATGALGPAASRVFWSGASSGGAAAAAYIAENGGTTLETTPLGRVANFAQNLPFVPQNSFTYSAWAWLSTAYAQGAQGAARYFAGAQGYQGQIWLNYELPTLIQNGVPIVTVPYP
jgi:RHS repeat-associated protein